MPFNFILVWKKKPELTHSAVAVRNTITRTGPAVMYAMLATAVGFYAMFISNVPMIRGFGLISIIGVITCYVTSLIGIPAVALFLNYKAKGSGKSKQSEFIRFRSLPYRRDYGEKTGRGTACGSFRGFRRNSTGVQDSGEY